jgi:hypothetical protein
MVYDGDGAEAQRRYIQERIFPDDALILVPPGGDFEKMAARYPDCVGVIETKVTKSLELTGDAVFEA